MKPQPMVNTAEAVSRRSRGRRPNSLTFAGRTGLGHIALSLALTHATSFVELGVDVRR